MALEPQAGSGRVIVLICYGSYFKDANDNLKGFYHVGFYYEGDNGQVVFYVTTPSG